MPSVIHTRPDADSTGRVCYACTITLDNSSWGKYHTRFMHAVEDYEDAVEWIERATAPFSIQDVFSSFPYRGPTAFRASQNAVHDMAGHGLVVCIRKSRHNKCILWEKITQ